MEHSPMPMAESDRRGLGRDCEAALVVAAMQLLGLQPLEQLTED